MLKLLFTFGLVSFVLLTAFYFVKGPKVQDLGFISRVNAQDSESLTPTSFELTGNKSFGRKSIGVSSEVLADKDFLTITYNLHGLCLLKGPSSALTFTDADRKTFSVSLSDFGKNCFDGIQKSTIPLKKFFSKNNHKKIVSFGISIWYPTQFDVSISDLTLSKNVLGTSTTTVVNMPYDAVYFSNQNLSGTPVLIRQDPAINFDWGATSPSKGVVPVDYFSARWTKTTNFDAGVYDFSVLGDDGLRLFIDNAEVINGWRDQASTLYKVRVALNSGAHTIKLEYYERAGGAVIKMDYKIETTTGSSSFNTLQTVDPLNSFLAKYWKITGAAPLTLPITDPLIARYEASVGSSFKNGTADSRLSGSNFLASWIKSTNFLPGIYKFDINSSGGVRLVLDGKNVLDNFQNKSTQPFSITSTITEGPHTVEMDYYQTGTQNPPSLSYTKIQDIPVVTVDIPTPISPTATASAQLNQSWPIQSVSSMKVTKDLICSQPNAEFINSWVNTASNLGANYISIETPYDNPSCGDAVSYTKLWITTIRSKGLHVWHRHMPLSFEGIYNVPKDISNNYLPLISAYIHAHPDFFADGDIFTPVPEPQNAGINGVTYCPSNQCLFKDAAQFNQWLRDAMTVSNQAFSDIGLGGKIKVGYYGLDGFITWGDNNPDWKGILEDATVAQMGNITIDHYPEAVGDTMQNDLNELQAKYPNTPIIIGEWGTITGGDTEQQVKDSMGAAKRKNVVGFNYWHMGMGGNEALINDDFSPKAQFDEVKSFYKP